MRPVPSRCGLRAPRFPLLPASHPPCAPRRLATAQAALDGERQAAAAAAAAERDQLADANAWLKRQLQEQTARADGLSGQLEEARAALEAAQQAAATAAAAAEQQHSADVATLQAALDSQRCKLQQADAFVAERQALVAQAEALQARLEEEAQRHHRRAMDMERKHAAAQELWRRDTAEAVQQVRRRENSRAQ